MRLAQALCFRANGVGTIPLSMPCFGGLFERPPAVSLPAAMHVVAQLATIAFAVLGR